MILLVLLLSLLLPQLIVTEPLSDGFFRSTGYACAGQRVSLSCDTGHMIIINKVVSGRAVSGDCSTVEGSDRGEYEYDFKEKCNGQRSCAVPVVKYDHLYGLYKATTNFISNRVNVFYSCIPESHVPGIRWIDICNEYTVSGVSEGFIHSPGYPSYYGNNRDCELHVKLPSSEHRMVTYLISMNMEDKGWLSRTAKDYLYVENTYKSYYGSLGPQFVSYDNKLVTLKFRSDFITTTRLRYPKGFLLYFKIVKVAPPTTTTASSTTTTTTTVINELAVDTTTTSVEVPVLILNKAEDELMASMLAAQQKNTESKNDRSVLLICTIVGLCGLVIVLVTTILLLMRRRQSQDPPSDDYYGNESFVDKIRSYYARKEKPKRVIQISAPIIQSESKSETVDETKKTEDEMSKMENIYVSNPFEGNTTSAAQNEEVYYTINENYNDQSKASTLDNAKLTYAQVANEKANNNNNNNNNNGDKISIFKTEEPVVYDELKSVDQYIYAIPTNEEISFEEKKKIIQKNELDTSVHNSSTAHLLP